MGSLGAKPRCSSFIFGSFKERSIICEERHMTACNLRLQQQHPRSGSEPETLSMRMSGPASSARRTLVNYPGVGSSCGWVPSPCQSNSALEVSLCGLRGGKLFLSPAKKASLWIQQKSMYEKSVAFPLACCSSTWRDISLGRSIQLCSCCLQNMAQKELLHWILQIISWSFPPCVSGSCSCFELVQNASAALVY